MTRNRRHGGLCCGLSHVYDLPFNSDMKYAREASLKDFEEACKRAFDNNLRRGYWNDGELSTHTIQLTTTRGAYRLFEDWLRENSWHESYSFVNGNSFNTVTVWHKSFKKEDFFPKKAEPVAVANPFALAE